MSAPAVAVSDDGKKFAAAWKDVHTGDANVYWSISNKSEFATDQLVHAETQGIQDHPSLCIDASETVWVAWEDSRAERHEIWIRSSRTADLGRPLTDPTEIAAKSPTIAAGKDLIAVVYESQTQASKTIQFRLVSPAN